MLPTVNTGSLSKPSKIYMSNKSLFAAADIMPSCVAQVVMSAYVAMRDAALINNHRNSLTMFSSRKRR